MLFSISFEAAIDKNRLRSSKAGDSKTILLWFMIVFLYKNIMVRQVAEMSREYIMSASGYARLDMNGRKNSVKANMANIIFLGIML